MEDPPWWNAARFRGYSFDVVHDADEVAEQLQLRAELVAAPVARIAEVGRLEPPVPDQVLLHSSVGAAGELVALWCAESDRSVFRRRRGSRPGDEPGSRAGRAAPAIVTAHDLDGTTTVLARIPALEVTYPMVQPIGDGTLLVVGMFCVLDGNGPERNALRIDRSGAVLERATLGDGIAFMQTTGTGTTWVGYADTGIYGSNGWGDSDVVDADGTALEPIGTWGLVRFDESFSVEWEFGRAWFEAGVADREIIDHVYALNVIDDVVWSFVYSSFAIVRVEHGDVRVWSTDVTGASVLLISGDQQALVGGYGPEFDRIAVGHLEPTGFVRDTTMRLVLPDGTDVPPSTVLVGRGRTLHAIAGDRWFRFDL